MKTWFYLPLLLLGFILPGCTKTTNEVVIPNQTILFEINPNDWGFDAATGVYFYSIPVSELNNVNQLDGVIVSMARYDASNPTVVPQSFELLPQVYNNQSYFIIHDDQAVEVDIKGVNGVNSQKPATKVRVKIVLIPSAQ
ncbi:hypothetical protein QFZ51_005711 [Chitinophaga sp. W3I9]|uniref:hypothetical protein n=1 Tax=unclassified Chitinophaga TaxID=2619133 RepID=UPI003D1BF797